MKDCVLVELVVASATFVHSHPVLPKSFICFAMIRFDSTLTIKHNHIDKIMYLCYYNSNSSGMCAIYLVLHFREYFNMLSLVIF